MREQLQQYEEAMKDPRVQAQTQELTQMMQSPEMLQKLAQLRVGLTFCSFHSWYSNKQTCLGSSEELLTLRMVKGIVLF